MLVVLISGKAESGKTLTSIFLKRTLEWNGYKVLKMAYGDYVKETATSVFGWDGNKDEKGRKLLQWWGTDVVRANEESFWTDTVTRLAKHIEPYFDCLIIDDVRFPNEIHCWDDKFKYLTVRVERPSHSNALTDEQRKHPSETAMDDYKCDVTLSANDASELEHQVEKVLFPTILIPEYEDALIGGSNGIAI